jgi:hypothetical protein
MAIKLTFLGGVGTVTGSKYLVESEGRAISAPFCFPTAVIFKRRTQMPPTGTVFTRYLARVLMVRSARPALHAL